MEHKAEGLKKEHPKVAKLWLARTFLDKLDKEVRLLTFFPYL